VNTDALNRQLDRLLAGDDALRAGFGLERVTAASPWWEEVLSVSGDGVALLTTVRSVADVGGEPIGTFHAALTPENIVYLADVIRRTDLAGYAPPRIEGRDLRVTVTVVVGGEVARFHVGAQPTALLALRPLLQELDRLAGGARLNPKCTLRLALDVPSPLARANPRPAIELTLSNEGTEGAWITHPGAITEDGRGERLALHYVPKPSPDPDVTTTVVPAVALLAVDRAADEPAIVWLPARGAVRFRATAELVFDAPGEHLVRAQYSTYAGEGVIAGRARLRGAVFSDELTVEVT
jgi:hypothetical protein